MQLDELLLVGFASGESKINIMVKIESLQRCGTYFSGEIVPSPSSFLKMVNAS